MDTVDKTGYVANDTDNPIAIPVVRPGSRLGACDDRWLSEKKKDSGVCAVL